MTNLTNHPARQVQSPERVQQAVKAIDIYANTGTLKAALFAVGLEHRHFYRVLEQHTALQELYDDTQRMKASQLVDSALEMSLDDSRCAKDMKARADIRLRIAAFYDRKKFGASNDLVLDAIPNLLAALTNANNRLPVLPMHDLATTITANYVDITDTNTHSATDKQSVVTDDFDPFRD